MSRFVVISGMFIALLSAISACSILGPVKTQAITTYALSTDINVNSTVAKSGGSENLWVNMPRANPGYGTDRMAYVTKPYEMNYFTKNAWVQPPAKMLQPLIADAMQASGRFHAVIMAPVFVNYHYQLDTQLLKLQQEFSGIHSLERFEINAQLIRTSDQKIMATHNFVYSIPVTEQTPYGGVLAANQAVKQWLIDLQRFVKSESK